MTTTHPSIAGPPAANGGGFQVVGEAADGAGALVAVRDLDPDVVLLDVQLPDLDGFAVAEVLAGEPSAPFVVLVSSRERLDYGHLVDASTARGFIAKAGLSGETLLQVVVDLPDAGQDRRVEIGVDGAGGADASGSLLRGMADRVAALSGKLSVRSPRGHGTRVSARVPCG